MDAFHARIDRSCWNWRGCVCCGFRWVCHACRLKERWKRSIYIVRFRPEAITAFVNGAAGSAGHHPVTPLSTHDVISKSWQRYTVYQIKVKDSSPSWLNIWSCETCDTQDVVDQAHKTLFLDSLVICSLQTIPLLTWQRLFFSEYNSSRHASKIQLPSSAHITIE
jgi:hypothetical protein